MLLVIALLLSHLHEHQQRQSVGYGTPTAAKDQTAAYAVAPVGLRVNGNTYSGEKNLYRCAGVAWLPGQRRFQLKCILFLFRKYTAAYAVGHKTRRRRMRLRQWACG
jgi:hypothetical protein